MKNILAQLNNVATSLEDKNKITEANAINEIFIKIAEEVEAAKKKKKSSSKNVPNNPSLWASCQAWAKRTYDIHPSAYSNAGAARRYREKGGTWRKEK